MVARKGYKLTEVGEIPKDWEVTPWDNALSIVSGQVDPKASPYCDMILVAPDHIESESGRIMKKETAKDQNAISGKYIFLKGDIVYSKIRPHLRKVYCPDFDGICSADMYPLRARQGFIHTLLFYILLSDIFSRFAESISARSGIPKINRRELSAYIFALPPTDSEQTAIATALSDADALIDALVQCIAKKRHIKQGAMQELLTGKRRLPGFEGEWEEKRLDELAQSPKKGITPSCTPRVVYAHFSLPAFDDCQMPTVEMGSDIGSNKFMVPSDAILLSKLNPRIPRVWAPNVIPENSVCSTEFIVLVATEHVERTFLYYICTSPPVCAQMEFHATGTTGSHQRINPKQALAIEVKIPRIKAEQAAIAAVLTAMDDEIAALEAKLSKARQIKAGMMQELLTGRIRLV